LSHDHFFSFSFSFSFSLSLSLATHPQVPLEQKSSNALNHRSYASASKLRDRIKGVEERLAAAAGAAALRAERSGAPPRLRLGARVLHSELGYRGAVAGWDACCLETPEWQRGARIGSGGGAETSADPFQPFYHVLVDARDWRGPEDSPPLAYVPQSRLAWPEDPECWSTWGRLDGGEESGEKRDHSDTPLPLFASLGADERELLHPYSYLLFLGADERGDMIPTKALRERYSQPRVDVYPPSSSDGGDE
jgi:hemimethylated DNA binding protein